MTKPTRTSWKSTLLVTLVAGGLASYAWDLREKNKEATADLIDSEQHAASLEQEHNDAAACKAARDAQAAECATAEKLIGEMKGHLNTTKAELESLLAQRKEAAARLTAFQDLTDRFRKMIDSGKLDVVIRNGRMVVQLPAGVLFDSGSEKLSREGELALMEVAVVLRHFKDRKFMVEGHTDSRPLESEGAASRFRNNWELSAARSVTVIEFLIEAKLKPQNLLAAGHGEFDPVGDNTTADGRKANRRIEIVLLPNVEELPPMDEASPEKNAKQKRTATDANEHQ